MRDNITRDWSMNLTLTVVLNWLKGVNQPQTGQ